MADWHWLAPPSWEPLRRCGQLLLQDPTSRTRVLHTPSAPLCLQWVTETPEPFVCFPGNGLDKASSKFHSMYIYIYLSLSLCLCVCVSGYVLFTYMRTSCFDEIQWNVCMQSYSSHYIHICVCYTPCVVAVFSVLPSQRFLFGNSLHTFNPYICIYTYIYICVCVYIYVDVLWFLRCCNFFIFPDMYGFLTFRSARSRVTARFGFYNYFGGNAIPFMVATYHGRVDWPKSCGQKSLTDHGFASVNYLASFALVGWWAQFGWATGG